MKGNSILLLCMISLTTSSCGFLETSSTKQTPFDEVIVGYKRALVMAQEKSLFEEFVKYKELHNTFSLYKISEFNIEATTNMKKSTSKTGEASIEIPIKGGLSASKTIEVGDEQGTTVSLKLEPIANSSDAYTAVRKIFDETAGLNAMYGLAFYNNSGKPTSLEDNNKCHASQYCIPISNLTDANNNIAFAYLVSYDQFRNLLNKIREMKVPKE